MSILIRLPAIASDFETGNISAWHKSIGDSVEKGDIIVDIETDKAVVEVEASDSGTLGSILCPAGTENVTVNTVIGELIEAGESIDEKISTDPPAQQVSSPTQASSSSMASEVVAPGPAVSKLSEGRPIASPLARQIAEQHHIDLQLINGSGPNQRILKVDVEQEIESRSSSSVAGATNSPQQPFTSVPNDNVRKTIARRLTEAKQQIPHFYLTIDCELDAILSTRQQINERHSSRGSDIKISINDCILKAAAMALRDVPAANTSWEETAIRHYDNIDISIAVATNSGLITPVIRHADTKSLSEISIETKVLSDRARAGRLQPDEYKGGGFTISNLGMYGVRNFSAIINPPQSCILAVGVGEKRPIVRNSALAVATVMTCTLSVDHRSVDGAIGAKFLQAIKQMVEKPALLLLD